MSDLFDELATVESVITVRRNEEEPDARAMRRIMNVMSAGHRRFYSAVGFSLVITHVLVMRPTSASDI